MPVLGHVVGREGLQCDPKKIEDVKYWPVPWTVVKSTTDGLVSNWVRGTLAERSGLQLCRHGGKDVPFVWRPACSTAFTGLRDDLVQAPILSFPTEDGDYILDTDASNFLLGGIISQIQDNVERVIAYCSRALRPSQRKSCTTIPRGKCWPLSLCVYSFVHIYVERNLHSERITSP